MEDDEDIWGNTNTGSSPSASPPQPVAACISTQLSLSSRLHLLSSAAAAGGGGSASPGRMALGGGGFRNAAAASPASSFLALGGGGFRNAAAASPASSFFPYSSLDAAAAAADVAHFDLHAAARGALEDELCLGSAAAAAASAAWAGGGGADRRKKRMIKNRESAARSRARKQAYVRELERKVQALQQENESLRVKYDELRVSVEVAAPMVRRTLQRVPSAPF